MNIAIYLPYFGARTETFIKRHALELFPDHNVWYITNKPAGHYNDWGVAEDRIFYLKTFQTSPFNKEVVNAFSKKLGFSDVYTVEKEFRSFIKKNKISVLMAEYLNNPFVERPELLDGLDVRFYGHSHGYDISRLLESDRWQEIYQQYNSVGEIITISEYSKNRLVDIGIDAKRIHVIPYGIPIQAKEKVHAKEDKSEKVNVLAVGRLVGKKAPILLLESFRRASEENPNLHLNLVGDGPLKSAVYDYLSIHNMRVDEVTIHGSLPYDEVLSLMNKAVLFIQHSVTDIDGDQEGVPLSILEAMSFSLPVVSTNHAGIPEAVIHGETGMLADERDVEMMSSHIIELSRSPDKISTFGKAGRRRIENNFTWEIERKRLRSLLLSQTL